MKLTLLYRGPLESCNYACAYCPFALVEEDEAALASDRRALERFVAWIEARAEGSLSVFFTPWGEALVRPWYRAAIARLTTFAHVEKVAVQTNLSTSPAWMERAVAAKLGIWATYHPGQVPRARFVERVLAVHALGAPVSAGVVGLSEHLEEIEALRRELPPEIYVWVNAFKRVPGYYDDDARRRLERVDPLFSVNAVHHPSFGRACRTGESVIAVDGDGTVRRCHFVEAPIGNLYAPDFEACLRPRPCPNATCGCHIGYVHLEELGLDRVFGAGILERVPLARASSSPSNEGLVQLRYSPTAT